MEIKKRIFGYDPNRTPQTYKNGSTEHQIAELAYQCFLELTGVTYAALNRAYTTTERKKNPKTEYNWASGHMQAKEFLTRYKNIVRDAVIPLAKITRHKVIYDDSQDQHTREFKQMIVDNCYLMLYTKLRDYGPLMLPEDVIESYNKVLETTYESVKIKLLEQLSFFEAEGKWREE